MLNAWLGVEAHDICIPIPVIPVLMNVEAYFDQYGGSSISVLIPTHVTLVWWISDFCSRVMLRQRALWEADVPEHLKRHVHKRKVTANRSRHNLHRGS